MRAKRSIAVVGAETVAVAALAIGGPAAAAEPAYPTALEGPALIDWMRRETDIRPSQVIAISPSAVTALIASYPTVDPAGLRLVVRAEAVSALARSRDGVLSWHVSVQTDCANRRVRLGETTGYAGRNLIGEGRMIRPLETDWRTALPDTPLDSIWRIACDRSFRRPLAPEGETIALAGPGGPIRTAPREVRPVDPTPPSARVAQAPPPRVVIRVPPAAAEPSPQAPKPPPAKPPAQKPPVEKPPAEKPAVAKAAAAPPPAATLPTIRAALRSGPVSAAAVQISATSSEAAARKDLATLRAKLGPAMAARTLKVEPVQAQGKTLWRALVTGFGSAEEADRFCAALKGRGQGCFVRSGG